MSHNTVKLHFEDGIAWLAMNRPEKKNAIRVEMAEIASAAWGRPDRPAETLHLPRARRPAARREASAAIRIISHA
jgi:hypothetical protein